MTSLRGGRSDPNDHSNYSADAIEEEQRQRKEFEAEQDRKRELAKAETVVHQEELELSSIVHDPNFDRMLDELENDKIIETEFHSRAVDDEFQIDKPLWQTNIERRRQILHESIEVEIDHAFNGYDVEDLRLLIDWYF
jgi:hypothetical protein